MALLHVYKSQTGRVSCIDEHGQQIPALQGPYSEVREAVLAAANERTEFHGWTSQASPLLLISNDYPD